MRDGGVVYFNANAVGFVILRSEATKDLTAQIFYYSHGGCRSVCCKILHFVQDDSLGN